MRLDEHPQESRFNPPPGGTQQRCQPGITYCNDSLLIGPTLESLSVPLSSDIPWEPEAVGCACICSYASFNWTSNRHRERKTENSREKYQIESSGACANGGLWVLHADAFPTKWQEDRAKITPTKHTYQSARVPYVRFVNAMQKKIQEGHRSTLLRRSGVS